MKGWLARWSRNLHIYLSLLGMLMFIFFALTGILLTHDSFGLGLAERTERELIFPAELRAKGNLAKVEPWLRSRLETRLALGQTQDGDNELELAFVGAGHRIQINMDRSSGRATVREENRGFVGLMGDLHRGADSGLLWKLWMDLISVWIILSSITGFVMLWWLPKRQRWGLIAAATGTLITVGMIVWLVPR